MNKQLKRWLLIAVGVVALCGVVWGGLKLAGNARRGSVNVYAVSDFAMTDYWGDTSQTSGMVSTDKMQKIFLSDTQKIRQVYVQEGQSVKKGDKLLSYDTTLTALDIERAQIDYERQQLQQENAKKELERLELAYDRDALEKKIEELTQKIEAKIAENQKNIFDQETRPIESIEKIEKPQPLQNPEGDGTLEKPLYFNWNSADELTAENLVKLLPEGKTVAYVVLVIHKDNTTLGEIVNCCGLRLEWVAPTQPEEPVAPINPTDPVDPTDPTNPTDPVNPTDPTDPVDPTDPAEPTDPTDPAAPGTGGEGAKATVRFFLAKLQEAPAVEINGVTDEVKAMQKDLEALNELLANAYTKEELEQMRREKLQQIAQMDVTIKLAKINLEKTKKEVGSDTVYSELDGTVKAVRDPAAEDFTSDKAVVEVSGGGGYYVQGAISELELGTVSVGETVQVTSWMTGTVAEGEIVEISEYPTENGNSWSDGNSNVSYYPFKAFVSEEANLQEGDYVEMSYQNSAGDSGSSLYIESMFVRTENGKSYVMARNQDGRLEQRWVQTGRNLWGSYTQIRGGLSVEDYVAFPYGRSCVAGAATQEATPDKLYNGM